MAQAGIPSLSHILCFHLKRKKIALSHTCMHNELFASFILIDVCMHLCLCVRPDAIHVHMGAHVCGGQRTALGVLPWAPTLFFVRQALTDLEHTRLSGWPQ